jgi:hypothetical protein
MMKNNGTYYCTDCPNEKNPVKSKMFKITDGKIVCVFCGKDNTENIKIHLALNKYK